MNGKPAVEVELGIDYMPSYIQSGGAYFVDLSYLILGNQQHCGYSADKGRAKIDGVEQGKFQFTLNECPYRQ